MRRLGSILLSGVLLGVPRALGSRAFGSRQPVYFEVAPDAGLDGFAEALQHALEASGWLLAASRAAATTVVDVVGLARSTDAGGRATDALTIVVREGRRLRRLVVHARPGHHAAAARELLACLGPRES
jgi:hypothetical protein